MDQESLIKDLQKKLLQESWLSKEMVDKMVSMNKKQTRILFGVLFIGFLISSVLLIIQFGAKIDLSTYSTSMSSLISGLCTIAFKMNNRKKYSKQATDHSLRSFKCSQLYREIGVEIANKKDLSIIYNKYNDKYNEIARDNKVIDNDVYTKFRKNCESAGIPVQDVMFDLKKMSHSEEKNEIQLTETEFNDEQYRYELRRLNQVSE